MLSIEFNKERCQELYKELGLKKPVAIRVYNRVRRTKDGRARYMGQLLSDSSWTPDIHQVVIEAGEHEHLSGLPLKEQMVITFLHECRHAHQHEYWKPEQWASELLIPYEAKPSEKDAEGWAKINWRIWTDVLTVRRITKHSRFGKLSAAQEAAKCR